MNTGDLVMLVDITEANNNYYRHRNELINNMYVVDWGGVVIVLLRPLFIDVGHIDRRGRLSFFRSSIRVLPLSPPTP